MNTRSASNINFYGSRKDIGVSEPYATISAEELTAVIKRFVSWAAMIATHPDIAETLGGASTTPIRLATDLRAAIKNALQNGIYPNVVLPTQRLTAAKTMMRISRQLEPEIGEMIIYESQKWEEEYSS